MRQSQGKVIMGWRFRKTFKILPGVRMSIGKKGISGFSFGKRGASISTSSRGTSANVGIPGSGLSYQKKIKLGRSKSNQSNDSSSPKRSSLAFPLAIAFIIITFLAFSFASEEEPNIESNQKINSKVNPVMATPDEDEFKPIPYVEEPSYEDEIAAKKAANQKFREEWQANDAQVRELLSKQPTQQTNSGGYIATNPQSNLNGGSTKNICGGNKGGISHCENGRFRCNDGSLSQSKKVCR